MGFLVRQTGTEAGFWFFLFIPIVIQSLKINKIMFTIEQAMRALRGSRGMALLFFNLGAIGG
jgi:hypothetical protein